MPFEIPVWFNRELQIPESPVQGAVSTSNVCESLASVLGSNPIILVGMDLAYTDSKRYAEGVTAHPSDDRRHHERLMEKVRTIPGINVEGNEVLTKWEWVQEASFFSEFSQNHPNVTAINATEGGLRILEVPHFPLNEVVQKKLTHGYDLKNWIHTEIEQSRFQHITEDKIKEAMEKWSTSLEKSIEPLQGILEELELLKARLDKGEELAQLMTGRMVLLQHDLESEDAHRYFLDEWNRWFMRFSAVEWKKLEFFPDQYSGKKRMQILYRLEKARITFLKEYAEFHVKNVKEGLRSYQKWCERLESYAVVPEVLPEIESQDVYLFENGTLTIKDQELNIAYEEPFHPKRFSEEQKKIHSREPVFVTLQPDVWDGEALLFYPDGTIEGQVFYREGLRHGPSSFYSSEGQLLARGWFWNDQRVGKSWQYTLSGQLCSLQRFREGVPHGRQEYYYPDGKLKTVINYKEGHLHGEVILYHPNGRRKRHLHFSEGRLQGQENYWDETGLLLIESHYQNGLPKDKSRTWHLNGRLAKEIVFFENPLQFDLSMWDESGKLVHQQHSLPDHPLDEMLKKSKELMESIEKASKDIEKIKAREHLA